MAKNEELIATQFLTELVVGGWAELQGGTWQSCPVWVLV